MPTERERPPPSPSPARRSEQKRRRADATVPAPERLAKRSGPAPRGGPRRPASTTLGPMPHAPMPFAPAEASRPMPSSTQSPSLLAAPSRAGYDDGSQRHPEQLRDPYMEALLDAISEQTLLMRIYLRSEFGDNSFHAMLDDERRRISQEGRAGPRFASQPPTYSPLPSSPPAGLQESPLPRVTRSQPPSEPGLPPLGWF